MLPRPNSYQGPRASKEPQHTINHKIRDNTLMVIDEAGNKLGNMSRYDALQLAGDKNLDLVVIHQASDPQQISIAKIMDYGKFAYEQNRKTKDSKKKQSVIKVKEVKVRPTTGDHDLGWMAANSLKWLDDNCQIKFKVSAYGRIGTKKELINEIYEKFLKLVETNGKVLIPLKQVTPVLYEALIVKK